MKKYSNKLIIMILSIVMLFSLAIGIGCDCNGSSSSGGGSWTPLEKKSSVTLDKLSEKLIVGDYLTIVATTNKVLEEDVVFESENPSVATVTERGKIEAISAGTTNIVAKYGKASAVCSITVEWDNSYPVLIDVDGLEKSYIVFKNSSFEFRPAIKYRGRVYEDAEFTFVSTNEDLVSFDGNVLNTGANATIGSIANCYVEASWRGFDSASVPLLRSDFTVEIKKEAYISLKGTSEDFIKLYTRNEFEGKTYKSESELTPEFYVEGEKVDVEFTTEIKDDSLALYENNTVKAKKFGETEVIISCEHDGQKYAKSIAIEIERPIADYNKEIGKFSSDMGVFKDIHDGFKAKTLAEEIYGTNDVTIIEAKQEHSRLLIEDNKILGVTGANDEVYHTVITIGTETEIYNVGLEVYGLYITEMADFDYFATTGSYSNYYYLANDIDASNFEFAANSNESGSGLMGIFEGNGHVISNITTKSKGIFGLISGGTIRNVAFTNAKLTGYYPCLLAHRDTGKSVLKNVYVEVDSIAERGGALYQQTVSASGTHENVIVVYGISQDGVREVMSKGGNSGNISTFAPNRATIYKEGVFKNCFSISYAPVGCSEPKGSDFSWASHMMAENQVIQGDATDDGKIPLTGVTDWDKELLAATAPADFLKTKAGVAPVKNDAGEIVTPSENAGTDVLKGIKAYPTFADLAADKAKNEAILDTFRASDYWTVIDGIPYWSALYVNDLKIVLKDANNNVYNSTTVTENETKLTISLEDGSQSYTDINIEVPESFELNGRTIRLKEMPTKPKYEEIVITAVINNVSVERVLTIFVTPEGKEVDETIAYSYDDKSLDLKRLNEILDLEGDDAITKDNIECYYIGGDTKEFTGELIIPVKVAYDRKSVEESSLTILVNGKLYMLNSVKAYTKIIDEAEDLKYFTLKATNAKNVVDGYFVVTKDIDASEVVFDEHVLHSGTIYPGSNDRGFVGVFDGQGHVISNVNAKSNGIFGNVMSAIIRNVAFTGVTTSGSYPALFAHNSNRGKDDDGNFTNVETELSNVYVQVDSVGGSGGLLFNNQTTPTSRFNNVVVEFLGFDDDESSREMGWVMKGSRFSVLGGIVFEYFTASANYKDIYKNCFAITKAPLDINGTCYHFAENQFDYTLNEKGGVASATAKDPFVTQVLNYKEKTVTPSSVTLGVKSYDTYADMAKDSSNNTQWLDTYDTDLWIVVNGVPYWKSLYAKTVNLVAKQDGEVVTDYVLGNADTELTLTLEDKGSVLENATITASSDELVISGNTIKLKNKPKEITSYEVTISANVSGMAITKTITVAVIPTGVQIKDVVYYSQADKELDFDAINEYLGLEGDKALSQDDVVSYSLGSETIARTGEIEIPVLLNAKGSGSNDKTVDSQVVRFTIGEELYELKNVMAYTKVIDEAEDFEFFVLTQETAAAGIEGYVAVVEDINMAGYQHATHTFISGGTAYPGNSDIGFHGVLDGQGHTISNFHSVSNGIFGNAMAPVVKNIAFTNVILEGYYATLFSHHIRRDGWVDGVGYTKEALFQDVFVEVDEIRVNTGRVNVLVNNAFPTSSKLRNVIIEMAITDEVLEKINNNTLKVGSIGGNKTAEMNKSLMFENVYSISKAPLYAEGSTPYFAENQVEITERNKNGIYIDAIGSVLDSKVTDVLNGKSLTPIKNYFAPRVKAYDDCAAMSADAEANATSLAKFNTEYWTIVNGVPVWNTAIA